MPAQPLEALKGLAGAQERHHARYSNPIQTPRPEKTCKSMNCVRRLVARRHRGNRESSSETLQDWQFSDAVDQIVHPLPVPVVVNNQVRIWRLGKGDIDSYDILQLSFQCALIKILYVAPYQRIHRCLEVDLGIVRNILSVPLSTIGLAVRDVFRQRANEDYIINGNCFKVYIRLLKVISL